MRVLWSLSFAVAVSSCGPSEATVELGGELPEESEARATAEVTETWSIVVLGGASSGAAATVAAKRTQPNLSVLLVEDGSRLGGSMTGGVSVDLLWSNVSSSGLFNEHRSRVARWYQQNDPTNLDYTQRNFIGDGHELYGLLFDPDRGAAIWHEMVTQSGTSVSYGWRLRETNGVVRDANNRVIAIIVVDANGNTRQLNASVFVDATEDGDLLRQAGTRNVDWMQGREPGRTSIVFDASQREYFAGEVFTTADDPLHERWPCRDAGLPSPCRNPAMPGTGAADTKVQAFTVRQTFQKNGYWPAAWQQTPPPGYNPERYTVWNPPAWNLECRVKLDLDPDPMKVAWSGAWAGTAFRRCLPHGKFDMIMDPEPMGSRYPLGTYATREDVRRRARDFILGWVYFQRTHGFPDLGLTGDDFDAPGTAAPDLHVADLYVRESTRMVGRYVMREADVLWESGQQWGRNPTLPGARDKYDAIATGNYPTDSHCVAARTCEGGFYVGTEQYQVPYSALVPRQLDGLLVSHAVSATHVAIGTLRIDQVRTSMGQAAGTAAALSVQAGVAPRALSVRTLQNRLAAQGQQLKIYFDYDGVRGDFGDDPLDWGFAYVQPLAARGAFPDKPGVELQPDRPAIPREEAAQAIVRGFGMTIDAAGAQEFGDVPQSNPFYVYVQTIKRRGVVSGNGCTLGICYRPSDPTTRGQLSKMLKVAAGFADDTRNGPHFFDVPTTDTYYVFVETLFNRGIVSGTACAPPNQAQTCFRPGGNATLRQLAKMLLLTTDQTNPNDPERNGEPPPTLGIDPPRPPASEPARIAGAAIQAEVIRTNQTVVAEDPSRGAVGNQALMFLSNGATLPWNVADSTANQLLVSARGQHCDGAPRLLVTIDGVKHARKVAFENSHQLYRFNLTPNVPHQVVVEFDNDLYRPGVCDRNLIVDGIELRTTAEQGFPAEQLTFRITGEDQSQIVQDAAASDGWALALWANSQTVEWQTPLQASGRLYLGVRAQPCEGAPVLSVGIDGFATDLVVPGNTYQTLSLPLPSTGAHNVRLGFFNDHYSKACDRNVFVDWLWVGP